MAKRVLIMDVPETEQLVDSLSVEQVTEGLRSRRIELDLSTEEVGMMMGVSGQTILNWEGRKTIPRTDRLQSWARVLDMRISLVVDAPGGAED